MALKNDDDDGESQTSNDDEQMTNGHPTREEDFDLYVLGALEGDEKQAIESHLAACADCARKLAAARGRVAALSFAAPRVEPSAAVKDRLLRQVRAESQAPCARQFSQRQSAGPRNAANSLRAEPPRGLAGRWLASRFSRPRASRSLIATIYSLAPERSPHQAARRPQRLRRQDAEAASRQRRSAAPLHARRTRSKSRSRRSPAWPRATAK